MIQEEYEPRSSHNPFLQTFESLGYHEKSLITKAKLRALLEQQCKKNSSKPFNIDLFQQFWEQSQANSRGEVQIGTVANVINEANLLLQKHIMAAEKKVSQKTEQLETKKQELKELQQYELDDDETINQKRRDVTTTQIKLNEYEADHRQFLQQKDLINQMFRQEIRKEIPPQEEIIRNVAEYSPVLLIIFHLTNVCVVLELIACTYRLNFFAILIFSQIYFLLFCGYLSQNAVKYLLIQLGGSIILDLAWLVLKAFTSVYVTPDRHTSNQPFLIACMIFLLAEILAKGAIAFNILPYREIRKKNEYFVILGDKIPLNKRVKSGFRKSEAHE